MANVNYPTGMAAILGDTTQLSTDSIKWALVRGYTYNSGHTTLADIVTAGGTIVATSGALASKTFTNGVFDAADDTFGTPVSGSACNAIVLHKATGTNSTSTLLFYRDQDPNLPVTPNGSTPIPIVHSAQGIFAVS